MSPSPPNSSAHIGHPRLTNTPITFQITVRDGSGVQLNRGGTTFILEVTGPGNAILAQPPYIDSGNGIYDGSFEVDQPGTYELKITLYTDPEYIGHPEEIAGSPYSFNVDSQNQPPQNSVPGTQTVLVGLWPVTFSAAGGNAISTSDPDAAEADIQVTLSAQNGLITLGGTSGLSFSQGDGQYDVTMTFTGTIQAINTALDGLRYTPLVIPFLLSGGGSLTISTDDLGNTGGGALTDTDTVLIQRQLFGGG